MNVITNNVPRDVLDGWELSPSERAQFDYIDWAAIERGEDSASFFRYKGEVYDLGEFQSLSAPGRHDFPRDEWDGIRTDSFFSALLVRFVDDGERVIVALALS